MYSGSQGRMSQNILRAPKGARHSCEVVSPLTKGLKKSYLFRMIFAIALLPAAVLKPLLPLIVLPAPHAVPAAPLAAASALPIASRARRRKRQCPTCSECRRRPPCWAASGAQQTSPRRKRHTCDPPVGSIAGRASLCTLCTGSSTGPSMPGTAAKRVRAQPTSASSCAHLTLASASSKKIGEQSIESEGSSSPSSYPPQLNNKQSPLNKLSRNK
mgnify:CR=1 FL=1